MLHSDVLIGEKKAVCAMVASLPMRGPAGGQAETQAGEVCRVAVVGRAASPGIDVTLHLVGREACLRRIDRGLEFIRDRADSAS